MATEDLKSTVSRSSAPDLRVGTLSTSASGARVLGATLYHCVTGAPPASAGDRMIDDNLVSAEVAGQGRYQPSLLRAIDAALKPVDHRIDMKRGMY